MFQRICFFICQFFLVVKTKNTSSKITECALTTDLVI